MGKKDNKLWLDDPEWEMLLRKSHKQKISNNLKHRVADQKHQRQAKSLKPAEPRTKYSRSDTDKEMVVNLKIALPRVKLPDFKRSYEIHRRKVLTAAGTLAGLVLLVGALRLLPGRQAATDKPAGPKDPETAAVFNPLIPLESVVKSSGEQTNIDYRMNKEKNVLAYRTKYNDASLTISQQKVPENIKSNPDELVSVANSISKIIEPLETQKGLAYIVTDEEFGAQSAVFATDEVMVFIRTSKELSTDDWEFYINQLTPRE